MQTRRYFIGNVATGLAGSIAAPGAILGANDRIRVGIVGAGERGMQLAREAAGSENTELAAFADLWPRRLEEAKTLAPVAQMHSDFRVLLEDRSIDAVLIATPQHLHAEQFIAALEAGKHVYVERAMAFTTEDARKMRAAAKASRLTVEVGHQLCSSGQVRDARNYLAGGKVGKVTAIHARMYRNTPHGKPHWTRPVFPDINAENVDWKGFLGSAPERAFDADRFVNWRLFDDYSGGSVFENMSHQLAFWYKVMDLRIPEAVTMTGGIYLWNDGREVPDTMSVAMQHSGAGKTGQPFLFTWDSGFGNSHPGMSEEVLGTDGTIVRSQQIRYFPQKVNRPEGADMLGQTSTEPRAHVKNFLDAIRTGRQTNCGFETGYRVSIACRMAVESYRQGRTVRWDSQREEIV